MPLRSLVWPIVALMLGIALGGSLFWGAFGPNVTEQTLERAALHTVEPPLPSPKEGSDEAVARYTFWLDVLTFGLVAVSAIQGFFLLRADRTARLSAEAAQAQTHNFSKLERPYLYIFNPEGLELEPDVESPFYYVTYDAANYGKTPATIEAVVASISVGKLPGELTMLRRWDSLMRLPIMLSGEKRTKLSLDVPETISIGDYADEDTPPTSAPDTPDDEWFYVQIVVKYRGPFTSGHETSACWRWEYLSLVPFEDDRFTYMR